MHPTRKIDIEMEIHIRSTAHHWGPLDPSVRINALWRWTPTLEINENTKISKIPRTTGQTDRQTYYITTQGILPWCMQPHTLHIITGKKMITKKRRVRPVYRHRDRRIDGKRRDGQISMTGPHWSPMDPSVEIKHRGARPPQCKLIQKKNHEWTSIQMEIHIILPFRVFEPVVCGRRCSEQSRAV